MTIVERIKEQYHVEDTLADADQSRSFELRFSGVSGEEETEIRAGIRELALYASEDGSIRLLLDMEGDRLRLWDGSHNYYFSPGPDRPLAVRWTVFGLVTGAVWTTELAEKTVSAGIYGAEQQLLAAALLKAAQEWLAGEPSLQELLPKIVENGSRSYARRGPSLTCQPIREKVWKDYDYAFLPVPCKGEDGELLLELYGDEDFTEQLRRYCRFVRGKPRYWKAIADAADSVRVGLYRQPVKGLMSALNAEVPELQSEYGRKRAVPKPERRETKIPKLAPDTLEDAFKRWDKWYRGQLTAMLSEAFLTDLWTSSEKAISAEIHEAMQRIQDLKMELRDFCVFSTLPEGAIELPRLDIGWDRIIDIENLRLSIPNTKWDSELLHRLQLQTAGLTDVWLTCPELAAAIDGAQFSGQTFGVPSLSSQTLVHLGAK